MIEKKLEPDVSRRLQDAYGLRVAPKTLAEVMEIFRDALTTPGQREFVEKIKAGKAVMAETKEDKGYSVILPEGETQVSCGADPILTALLRRQGLVRAACPHCGEKMQFSIEGNRVVQASLPSIVFWMGGGPEKRAGGIDEEVLEHGAEEICSHIHLFPNKDHLEAWVKSQKDELGVSLSLNEIVNACTQIALTPFLK